MGRAAQPFGRLGLCCTEQRAEPQIREPARSSRWERLRLHVDLAPALHGLNRKPDSSGSLRA
jgi:hypothetical protein